MMPRLRLVLALVMFAQLTSCATKNEAYNNSLTGDESCSTSEPVFEAASTGNIAKLKELKIAGKPVDFQLADGKCKGWTPLMIAAANGRTAAAAYLLEQECGFEAETAAFHGLESLSNGNLSAEEVYAWDSHAS